MTCNTKLIQVAVITLVAIALSISSISADNSISTDNSVSVTSDCTVSQDHDDKIGASQLSQTASPVNTTQSAEQTNVIDGEFDLIDWSSLVGQNVTIQGDLVIVDTFDLYRRGQVRVARNRLYVPTSKIDPNDANADDNSFEGGSNVAQVIAAQKQKRPPHSYYRRWIVQAKHFSTQTIS